MSTDRIFVRDATPEDAPVIARVHVDGWRTTYMGILPQDVLRRLSLTQRRSEWRDRLHNLRPREIELVAVDPQQGVIGFASGGAERKDHGPYDGELYAIYVLDHMRGQGIGHLLFERVVEKMREMEFNGLTVSVLDDNPYKRFYESLGGQIVGHDKAYFDGQEFDEIAYGWPDLKLAGRADEGPPKGP